MHPDSIEGLLDNKGPVVYVAGLEPVGKWYTGPVRSGRKRTGWNHMPNR